MLQSYTATGVVSKIIAKKVEKGMRVFFRLEIKEFGKKQNGKQAITVIPCVLWNHMAENFMFLFREGDFISLSGTISTSYDSESKRSYFQCDVERFTPVTTSGERMLRDMSPYHTLVIDNIFKNKFGSSFILRDTEKSKLLNYFDGSLSSEEINGILNIMFSETDYSANRFVELAKDLKYRERDEK